LKGCLQLQQLRKRQRTRLRQFRVDRFDRAKVAP
jgi:hypothetical protein